MAATTETHRPTIGLNESKLGIVAPPWLGQQIRYHRTAKAELSRVKHLVFSAEAANSDLVVPQDQVEAASVGCSNKISAGESPAKDADRLPPVDPDVEHLQTLSSLSKTVSRHI
jgi:hypothetical protein